MRTYTMIEADTCRKFGVPLLQTVGWDRAPYWIADQRCFTAACSVAQGPTARRRPVKRADDLLRSTRELPLAFVEAILQKEPRIGEIMGNSQKLPAKQP